MFTLLQLLVEPLWRHLVACDVSLALEIAPESAPCQSEYTSADNHCRDATYVFDAVDTVST